MVGETQPGWDSIENGTTRVGNKARNGYRSAPPYPIFSTVFRIDSKCDTS